MSQGNRATGLLLDTHIWVDYINGDDRLHRSVVARIEHAREQRAVYISIISVWELAMLVQKSRLRLPSGTLAWAEQAIRLPGTQLLPLSPVAVVRSVDLARDLNQDPADRILVATAESENLQLVTRDRDVIRFAKKFTISFLNAREKVHAE